MSSFINAGGIGFIILAAALLIGLTRRRRGSVYEPTVYRMLHPGGPVETFDVSGRPSPSRVTARGEGVVVGLTRQHMAGPGTVWFEPSSPLIFQLDAGDIHVIPRERVTSVERYDGDEPHPMDEQILKITLNPGSSLWMITVNAKLKDLDKWAELQVKSS